MFLLDKHLDRLSHIYMNFWNTDSKSCSMRGVEAARENILNLLPATRLPRVLIWYKALFATPLHLLKFSRSFACSGARLSIEIDASWAHSFIWRCSAAGTWFLLSADFSVAKTSERKESVSLLFFISLARPLCAKNSGALFSPQRILIGLERLVKRVTRLWFCCTDCEKEVVLLAAR